VSKETASLVALLPYFSHFFSIHARGLFIPNHKNFEKLSVPEAKVVENKQNYLLLLKKPQ
jgi:hypothetical protein